MGLPNQKPNQSEPEIVAENGSAGVEVELAEREYWKMAPVGFTDAVNNLGQRGQSVVIGFFDDDGRQVVHNGKPVVVLSHPITNVEALDVKTRLIH